MKKWTVFKIIRWPLIATQFFTSLLFIFALKRLNILQCWQFALVCLVLLVFFTYSVYAFFFRTKIKLAGKIVSCTLAVLVSIVSTVAFVYVQQANDFISHISGEHYEVQVYEIRALKESHITSLEQLSDKKLGFISTNPNLADAKANLKEKLASYQDVDYEDVGSLLLALYNKDIDAVVISRSYLDFLEENESAFENDTIALDYYEVTADVALDLRTPVNVAEEPFIVYISGSDSRGTINDVSRSDVNILAVVNPQKGKILLVNVPRDYYVQLHGTTGLKDKLTHAGLYGIEMSKNTIEDILGVKINYTIRVGFQTVRKLVDAIGGIDIESDMQVKQGGDDRWTKICYIKKGRIHLDGTCALAYSRHRKTLKDGDLDRGKHQQQVLTAIIEKITDIHYVTHYTDILNAAKDTFQTSFTETEITDFVRYQLAELKHWQVESIQIGTSDHILTPTYTIRNENLWVYLPDEEGEKRAKQKIAEYLQN